jgi:hypothetical protein
MGGHQYLTLVQMDKVFCMYVGINIQKGLTDMGEQNSVYNSHFEIVKFLLDCGVDQDISEIKFR